MPPRSCTSTVASSLAESKLDDLVSIEAAAKKIRMRRDRFRALCLATGIAVKWGGTEKHPRLKVKLSEAERVILSRRAEPPTATRRTARPRRTPSSGMRKPLHPDVRC